MTAGHGVLSDVLWQPHPGSARPWVPRGKEGAGAVPPSSLRQPAFGVGCLWSAPSLWFEPHGDAETRPQV